MATAASREPDDPPSAEVPPLDRTTRLVVAGFVALALALGTLCAWLKSDTYDEPMYILSGWAYVATGDFSINREHPPVAKLLLALPLLALDLELPPAYQQRPGIAFAFVFHQAHADPRTIVFLARLPGVLLAGVLALYVFRWARAAFGRRAGLLALALVSTNPAVVAHSAIAGNDFPLVVFICATLYHVWRWLTTDRKGSLAAGAVMLGLAIGCKLTALMLLPVIGVIVLVEAIRRRRPSLLAWATLALFAAGGLLWIAYLGEARTLADARGHVRFRIPDGSGRVFATDALENGAKALFGEDRPVPLLGLLKAVDMQLAHNEQGHATYLRGAISMEGFPDFYVQSWLMKAPIGLTLLLALGLVALRRTTRGPALEGLLYLFPLLAFVVFSRARIQLGFTYILPVVPPLCVAASRVLALGRDGGAPRAGRREALLGLLVVLAVSAGGFVSFDDKGDSPWIPWVPVAVPLAYALWVGRRLLAGGDGAGAALAPAGASLAAGDGSSGTPAGAEAGRSGTARSVRVTGPARLLGGWAVLSALAVQPDALAYFNEWVGGRDNGWHYSVVRDDWGQDTATLGRWMAENGVEHVFYDKFGTGDPEAWGVRHTPTNGRPPRADAGWIAVHVNRLCRRPLTMRWLGDTRPRSILGGTILLYRMEDVVAFHAAAREGRPAGAPAGDGGAPGDGAAAGSQGAAGALTTPEDASAAAESPGEQPFERTPVKPDAGDTDG